MRFSSILAVLAAACISNVSAATGIEDREADGEASWSLVARDAVHARDFSAVEVVAERDLEERAKKGGKAKCKLHKKRTSSHGSSDVVYVWMNEVESSATKNVDVAGVNGCSGVYVWADKLYAAHVASPDIKSDIAKLGSTIGSHKNQITHVTVSAPVPEDQAAIAMEVRKWTTVPPRSSIYPGYNPNSDTNMWEMTGNYKSKGVVHTSKIA